MNISSPARPAALGSIQFLGGDSQRLAVDGTVVLVSDRNMDCRAGRIEPGPASRARQLPADGRRSSRRFVVLPFRQIAGERRR